MVEAGMAGGGNAQHAARGVRAQVVAAAAETKNAAHGITREG